MALKFSSCFVAWLMKCITSTHFSIIVNGEAYGYFKVGHGFQQGHPLSPYIFDAGLEYLSRCLMMMARVEHFKFHPECEVERIILISFADVQC